MTENEKELATFKVKRAAELLIEAMDTLEVFSFEIDVDMEGLIFTLDVHVKETKE